MKYFFPILGLIFITLKLMGHIAWSWWWVLLPLYFPVALWAGALAFAGLFLLITAIAEYKDTK